jgi:ElaA protein
MITFTLKSFQDLSVNELYALLRLRSEVFVVEQNCPYLDIDNADQDALHLLGIVQDNLATYMRLFPPTQTESHVIFGRIVSSPSVRGKGYGKDMMHEAMAYSRKHFPGITVKFSAQLYLKRFYESFGFEAYGEIYEEDGIPHIAMKGVPT